MGRKKQFRKRVWTTRGTWIVDTSYTYAEGTLKPKPSERGSISWPRAVEKIRKDAERVAKKRRYYRGKGDIVDYAYVYAWITVTRGKESKTIFTQSGVIRYPPGLSPIIYSALWHGFARELEDRYDGITVGSAKRVRAMINRGEEDERLEEKLEYEQWKVARIAYKVYRAKRIAK
jgi:hypothetical protein